MAHDPMTDSSVEAVARRGDAPSAAWPLYGYAPGHYMGVCFKCKAAIVDCDKRAISCLECAVIAAKKHIHELAALSPEREPMREALKRAVRKFEHWSHLFGKTPGYEQIADELARDAEAFRSELAPPTAQSEKVK